MKLDTHVLRETHRVLLTLRELAESVASGVSIESLIQACDEVVYYGHKPDYDAILQLALMLGFVVLDDDLMSITSGGSGFLSLNPMNRYDIVNEQQSYLLQCLWQHELFQEKVRNVLHIFTPDIDQDRLVLDLTERRLLGDLTEGLGYLRALGKVSQEGEKYVLNITSSELAQLLLPLQDAITEDQLLESLEEKRQFGALAESIVVQFEQHRLNDLGRTLEATLVRRISHLDVSAGYDIKSFDGVTASAEFNRYIEVKATQSSRIQFFWSANERKIAEKLGKQYWIYVLTSLRQDSSLDQVVPVLIQDPATRLPAFTEFQIEPASFRIIQQRALNISSSPDRQNKAIIL